MPDFVELALDDGLFLRLEVAPVNGSAGEGTGERGDQDSDAAAHADDDMPDGFGGVTPVGRGRTPPLLSPDTLETALRPLGPLLQRVHDSLMAAPDPPDEVSVSFGLQLGHDLRLGVVGVNGQASMNVSASWHRAGRT
ncbi:CU044_2847 family protein [Streptomyces daliensis]|uniref:Trypsin-co-occurring domain-containing protein n=1 Tax=Streptomyces daliensis TaxID=299421 RepID=A0A8T4J2E0_9ACTN|nr:hypothetical protein [Streptomyces daliensis]